MNLDVQQGLNFLKKQSNFLKLRGIRKLAQSKDRDAIRILREFKASKPAPELVDAVEEALEELDKYFKVIDSVKLVDRKQVAIDAEEKERQRALKVFDEKIQILAKRLAKEKSEYVRATLVKEIGRFKNVFTIDILAQYLRDPDDRVRANTVEALAMIRNPLIIPHIAPMLSDPNARVKANVLKALWTFGQHQIYPHLEKMMVSGTAGDKKSALFVLKNIKTVESYKLVKEAMNDPDQEVRETARKIIPEFGLIGLMSILEGPLKLVGSKSFQMMAGMLAIIIVLVALAIFALNWEKEEPEEIINISRPNDGPKRVVHYEYAAKYERDDREAIIPNPPMRSLDAQIPADTYERMRYFADNNIKLHQAMFLYSQGHPAEAVDLCLKAAKEDPENLYLQVYCWSNLQRLYEVLGKKKLAREAYEKYNFFLKKLYEQTGVAEKTPAEYMNELTKAFQQ